MSAATQCKKPHLKRLKTKGVTTIYIPAGTRWSLSYFEICSSWVPPPWYSPFVRLSENSDFGSISGTHSESSRRSWKLRFIFQGRAFLPLASCTKTSSKFQPVKMLWMTQAGPATSKGRPRRWGSSPTPVAVL